MLNCQEFCETVVNRQFNKLQAYLGDTAGSIPEHHDKVNIAIKHESN